MGRASITELVDDHLLGWILAAVAVGFLLPSVAVITRFSTLILAVMVGSTSLTLSVSRFRSVEVRVLARILLGHVAMPFVAFAIARILGLSPGLTAGFVLLGAVTPELVTPTMTELAGGDTALASATLVITGLGSLAFVPAVVTILLGATVPVNAQAIVESLLVTVVIPMSAAVGVRTRYEESVARYDEYYSTVSAVMVVLIIGGVTAANAALVRSHVGVLVVIVVGTVALNAFGYLLGWATTRTESRKRQVAATLSVGMRDFAIAAALVVSAGFPKIAALPAVSFGIVEMVTSSELVRRS